MATAKKLPSGNYRCRVYDKRTGKTRSFTAPTKKEAEFLANEWLTGRKILPPAERTVRQCIEDYIELKRNVLSPKTVDTYFVTLKHQYSEPFLDLKLSDLDSIKIQREVNLMTAQFAPKTVHNAHGLFASAVRTYFPSLHWNVTLPVVQKRARKLPTAEEIIPLFIGSEIELVVLLAVWLGLRMGEIRGLEKSDFSDGTILITRTKVTLSNGEHIEKDTAKTKESRRPLEVPEIIMRLVRELPEGKITQLNGRQIYDRFVDTLAGAGITGVTFHDLRHVNASTMLKLGIPDKYAMERGGWSTTSTLKRVYQETFSSERRTVDAKIDDYFQGVYNQTLDTKIATTGSKPA
ncbi:MAG: site-specific integrase [Ruminococcus sp.]|nr:site-specific integrase [Ruminococcus sp.]MBQ5629888.1 site-specific integrase [Ruminococcus sp.]